jgi:bifunctional non-homologous end joining protein LigD
MADSLKRYREKRDFSITPEPVARGEKIKGRLAFVIQKHWARRLHYDFRIELNGTMKSWAVPKGPSFDPQIKRMAMHVEDHPISYNTFEGDIPTGQYGAGKVIIWDKGMWEPIGNAAKGYADGHLKFHLYGHKLAGTWALVRMNKHEGHQDPWLLIKEKDEYAQADAAFSVVDERPHSVAALDLPPLPEQTAVARGEATRQVAKKSALPGKFSPQLATLVEQPPLETGEWLYELKFDGYRLLTRVKGRSVQLWTRNGNDWTAQLSALAKSLQEMKLPDGWYDGEIVVLGEDSLPNFQLLQQAFEGRHTNDIVYYLFDVAYCGGYDIRDAPLIERRKLLKSLFHGAGDKLSGNIRFSDSFDVDPHDILASACRLGLEGMIGKRIDSSYTQRRSPDWIKLKCGQRQEFVIVGHTDPQGSRAGFGSLLLAVHDKDGRLRYAGNVGSGFDDSGLGTLSKKLHALHIKEAPLEGPTGKHRKVHWVKPTLVAEISFSNWTAGGHVRHAVFRGLRTDKNPEAIVREKPASLTEDEPHEKLHEGHPGHNDPLSEDDGNGTRTASPSLSPQSSLSSLRVTHPDRIVDKEGGTSKIEVLRYYALVAPLMMEHLKGRPVSLVRAPTGVGGELFFQKHLEQRTMEGIRPLPQAIDPDHPPYLEVAVPLGLLSAAQMNVLEFHTWNGTRMSPTKPDRFIFDLDPGSNVSWAAVQEAAILVRGFLQELGLQSLLKTSGGKGLHILVPLRRQHGWDTVKHFSHAIVTHLAQTLPERFSAKSGSRNRVGRIFLDYIRNGFGATTACAWSLRARPGMGVSVPVSWDELERLQSGSQWNVSNIHTRLDRGNAPWSDKSFMNQSLTSAMRALGFRHQES